MITADSADPTRLPHQAREDLTTGADPAGRTPARPAAPWRPSVVLGVRPGAPALPYADAIDPDNALSAAASPVLTRLAERLSGSRAAILLADREGRILKRWVDDAALRALLDATHSAPGFYLREEYCTASGPGTATEEDRSFTTGADCFAEQFADYACFGAPVRHPATEQLQGTVTFLCRTGDATALMPAFLEQTCQIIQDRIVAAGSLQERRLLDAFIAACRRRNYHAVLAVDEHTLIATPAAFRLLDGVGHGALWELAARAVTRRGRVQEAWPNDSGRTLSLHARPVLDGDRAVGALVELTPLSTMPSERREDRSPPAAHPQQQLLHRLGGTSRPWRHAMAQAAFALKDTQPVLIVGEAGTGKSELARALHESEGTDRALYVLNATLAMVDGPGAWLAHVRAMLGQPATLVLTHLEALPHQAAAALAALIDERAAHGATRLIGTVTRQPGAQPVSGPHLDRLAIHRVDVPALRERSQDIPDLVERLLRRHGAEPARPRPEVLQALARAPWPGNIRQLDLLIRSVAAQRPAGEITLTDLPVEVLHPARQPLTQLADTELQTIVSALHRAGGNKKLAARELGISRSTLYRKLRSYHIDLDGPPHH